MSQLCFLYMVKMREICGARMTNICNFVFNSYSLLECDRHFHFKPNHRKCKVWNCVFKQLQFENVEKFAFLNRKHMEAFSKMYDIKCQTAILPNA
jgi:hypothetical protein